MSGMGLTDQLLNKDESVVLKGGGAEQRPKKELELGIPGAEVSGVMILLG